ncbi:MAG: HAD family hydrolase, partial [Lachnospiraceae bacterium]|nr:HAD family hydrolase [Lachnospiraceae bacterium]
FDAYVKDAMRTGFKKYGLPEYKEEMFDTFTTENAKLWHRIEDGTLTFDELIKIRWNCIFRSLGISFDGVEFETYFRQFLNQSAIPVKGSLELLKYLDGKYIICAASNGPYDQQINRLKIGNMHQYFSHFFISEKIGASKPAKDFFDYCFDELGSDILPSEIIIIGDSLSSDMEGGISNGLKTCYYDRTGNGAKNKKVDHIVTDLEKITDIL